jgi:hypothetical protein
MQLQAAVNSVCPLTALFWQEVAPPVTGIWDAEPDGIRTPPGQPPTAKVAKGERCPTAVVHTFMLCLP